MIELLKNIQNTNAKKFFLIAGPCVIESDIMTRKIIKDIISVTDRLKIPFIFKSSYRKANRSRLESFTGIGDKHALEILKNVRDEFKTPVLTDIHSVEEAKIAADYVDILQIPAFLSRQTDILIAAAKTGKYINIKKGQFSSPESINYAIEKIKKINNNILLTERGTSFGYQDLIVDYRSIPKMKKFGYPVILDVTHSLQKPNQASGVSGGEPEFIETIAKAGVAAGIDGVFLETHYNPAAAKSDGNNVLNLSKLEDLLSKLIRIKNALY